MKSTVFSQSEETLPEDTQAALGNSSHKSWNVLAALTDDIFRINCFLC